MKGTWSPQHPGSAGKGLWRHCLTNRGRPRLGTWSLWVLTNRHLGQSGNCLRCQETTDGVQATRKKKYLRTASHPHLKWKIGNFMQGKKKKTKTNVIGHEPLVFCENTWQARPHISRQNPSRCERVMQSQQTSVSDFLTENRGHGHRILNSFTGQNSPRWEDFQPSCP